MSSVLGSRAEFLITTPELVNVYSLIYGNKRGLLVPPFFFEKDKMLLFYSCCTQTFNSRFHVLLVVNVQFLSIKVFIVTFIFSPLHYFGWTFRRTLRKFQKKSISSLANIGKEHITNSFANQSHAGLR